MKLTDAIKSRIKNDALNTVQKLKIDKRTNLYIHDEVLVPGERLRSAELEVPINRETGLVFVDLAPECNWTHPCEYHLYDAKTGKFYEKVEASLPPSVLITAPKATTAFHVAVKVMDTQKRRAAWKKRNQPIINAASAAPGERYAILFAGHAENRHTNDLEFLYRTLMDDYEFVAENIHVLNHDGTLNYYGASTPIGNWPGNNTPYRMNVTGQGTRAGFQTALNAIAALIQPEDMLFIHTNNHGGGPCDPGVNDYCMFVYDVNANWIPYYVNDFIADLSVLPRFEVLMVMMEQCRAGGFVNPIINNSPATWNHVVSAVEANDYSLAGADFDPFAEDWIAAIHGQYADGTGLSQAVDTNSDGLVSAAEAFVYANAVRTFNGGVYRTCTTPGVATCQSCGGVGGHALRLGDTPIFSDSPSGIGSYIFLGLPAHDLYLRDNLEDHGREPLIGGGISCSPDIIVYNQELLDPEAELGTPAAQQSDTLGSPVEFGQDNYIYLRVQNRGTQPTSGTGKLYWALPSVLPTPGSWTEITDPSNPIAIPVVNPNDMKVIGPIVWKKDDIPAIGHYCFIGLINNANDPAPDPATIHNISDYYKFIQLSNNATWKNFDIENMFKDSLTNMNFMIQGWPKIKLSADLMIDLSQLPAEMQVTLRILKRLSCSATLENANLLKETSMYQQFQLIAGKRSFLRKMNLKMSDNCQTTLEIIVPQQIPDGNYRLAVAELVDGNEIGRVTRMLAVGQYPFIANHRTNEVHVSNCEWGAKISVRNKVAYQKLELALQHGRDGCRYCLPEYSKD